MLNDHFQAKKITNDTTGDGVFLHFDVKEKVAEKLVQHCDKIGIKLTLID